MLPKIALAFNRLVDAARHEKRNALVLSIFPDFNFVLRRRSESSACPSIFTQPPALGVAPEPNEGDEAARGPRARDFPVRRTDYRDAGVPVRSSAIRSSTSRARRSPKTSVCAKSVSIRSGRSLRCCQGAVPTSRAAAADHPRRGREDSRRDCHAQFVIARAPRSTIACSRARSGAGSGPSTGTGENRRRSRDLGCSRQRQVRPPFRPPTRADGRRCYGCRP